MPFDGRCNHRGDLLRKETEAATDVQADDASPLVENWPLMVADLGTEERIRQSTVLEANATHRIRCRPHDSIRAGRKWKSTTDGSEYVILAVKTLRGRRNLTSMIAWQEKGAQW